MSLVLGVAGLTGCQKDTNPVNNGGKVMLSFESSPAQVVETRTIMEGDRNEGFNTAWDMAADKLGVYAVNDEASATANAQFGITAVTVDGVATFEGALGSNVADRTYDLYAYYPWNPANNNAAYTSVAGAIPASQTMPANGTFDPAADYMVTLPGQVTVAGGQATATSVDDFRFRYLVGFMQFAASDITAEGISASDVVKSLKITAEAESGNPALSGDFTLDLTDGAMNFTTTSNEVTVACPEGITLGDLNAWAIVKPFALAAADRLTFLITTETHTIEKSVPLTEAFEIVAGGIKTFQMGVDDNCTITKLGGGEPRVILFEGFDDFNGTAYPESGSVYSSTAYNSKPIPDRFKTEGWGVFNDIWTNLNAGRGCVRIGTGVDLSRLLVTPALAAIGDDPVDVVVTFQAYAWNRSAVDITVTADRTATGTVTAGMITLPGGVADGTVIPDGTGIESPTRTFTYTIPKATSATRVSITQLSNAVNYGRFIVDNIKIVTAE